MPDFPRSRPMFAGPAVALLAAGFLVSTASAGPVPAGGELEPGDDASALVRSIREREAWIDRVESLWIRAEMRFEVTPAGIARRRRELRAQGADERTIAASRTIRPVTVESIELAFDRGRLRWPNRQDADWFDLRVCDGRRLVMQSSYDTPPDRRAYLIAPERGAWFSHVLSYFDGFRAGPRKLGWAVPPEDREAVVRLMGRPEDDVHGGRETFHGVECHVVSRWENWTTFFIAVADGRLRGERARP